MSMHADRPLRNCPMTDPRDIVELLQ